MESIFSLKGKTALVTGSSRGIGRAIACELAQNGANVIIHCTGECPESEEVLGHIRKLGVKAYAVYANLAEANAAEFIYKSIKENFILPDILISNASVQIRNSWDKITDCEFDVQMNVNFRSALKLIQLFVPNMKEKHWGRIITVGSVQQVKPHEQMLIYSATKVAQMSMVTSLALQLAPDGITVNNIAPGTIYTDRNTKVLSDANYLKKVQEKIPMEFIGEPEDCAGTALLLCGRSGRFITGENIYIDGGTHCI